MDIWKTFVMMIIFIWSNSIPESHEVIMRDIFHLKFEGKKWAKNDLKIGISISMENALNRKRRNRPPNAFKFCPIILKICLIILIVITSRSRYINSIFHLFNRLEKMIFLSWDI